MSDAQVTLVTFRLVPSAVDVPFNIQEDNMNRDFVYVDWSSASLKTSEELTAMLQKEIINYSLNNNILQGLCEQGSSRYFTIYLNEDGEERITIFTPSTNTCANHISDLFQKSISDVLSRDTDAMHPNIGVNLHVVVLLDDNEYFGHIYVWKHNMLCVAIGIRSRIDLLFLRDTYSDGLRDISGFLLEGVRRFALINGCTKIVVPYPLKNMKRILEAKGFVTECMWHSELGEGPGIIDPHARRFADRRCLQSNTIDVNFSAPFASADTYIVVQ